MRRTLSISLVLALVCVTAAFARPAANLDLKFESWDAQEQTDYLRGATQGVFGTAQADTTFYGGTVWDAVDMRWEAIQGSCWTFETGVGSGFGAQGSNIRHLRNSPATFSDDLINPFKDAGLHTTMEGWYGVDNSFATTTFFRRTLVGQTGPIECITLGGTAAFYAGVTEAEAIIFCYAAGQGYGNGFNAKLEKTYTVNSSGPVSVAYDYRFHTELNFDFVYFNAISGATTTQKVAYTDVGAGAEAVTLVQGTDIFGTPPYDIRLQFNLLTDGAWSDEDGSEDTDCPFVFDNFSVSGAGITSASDTQGGVALDDFEIDEDGWALSPFEAGLGGEFSTLRHESDLPTPLTLCSCNLADSVLTFFDENFGAGGHVLETDNIAASPIIDLEAADLGRSGRLLVLDFYADMPLLNFVFGWYLFRWWPEFCVNTGQDFQSNWQNDGFVIYFGNVPNCNSPGVNPFRRDYSSVIPAGAEEIQAGIGVINLCDLPMWVPDCTNLSNTTPWYDNVKLGIYGVTTAPQISLRSVDNPQDAFPQNGTLRPDAPGRMDSNNMQGASEPGAGVSLGDTIVIQGGLPGAQVGQDQVEVRVVFAVCPGPANPQPALDNWLSSHQFETNWLGKNWYSARCDTAELIASPAPGAGVWATMYHESDPNFSGADSDPDPTDPDPVGGISRAANDIFVDGNNGLFTPGTQICMFFSSKYLPAGSPFLLPDTSGGVFFEMEVLPSSMASDSTWNCVLYVDHFDGRGGQPPIEAGLGSIISGTSDNCEGTPWDRYDVEAPSSGQFSLGRPLATQNGMTFTQSLGYDVYIWNSGNLGASNFDEADGQVLRARALTLEVGVGRFNFYGSGDGLAHSISQESVQSPTALLFLNTVCGVTETCNTFRDAGCPTGSLANNSECVEVLTSGGAAVGNGGNVSVQGNGCPLNRSFDVLEVSASAIGTSAGDEGYSAGAFVQPNTVPPTNDPAKTADFASISSVNASPAFQTMVDGASVHYRRPTTDCPPFGGATAAQQVAITDRLDKVLDWFGFGTSQVDCSDPGAGLTIPNPEPIARFTTSLGLMAPNPLPLGAAQGKISFSMARSGDAKVSIYDVNGRLVKVLFDGVAAEGVNEVFWDGSNDSGNSVASGVYFYKFSALGKDYAKKMVAVQNGGK